MNICTLAHIKEQELNPYNEIIEKQPKTIDALQDFFKCFGDSTRLRILFAMQECEIKVSDLAKKVELNQTTLSHQLAKLRAQGLVKNRREGTSIYYSLDDDHVKAILEVGLNHILHIGDQHGNS